MRFRNLLRLLALIGGAVTIMLSPANSASAHTGLESTAPADQETVTGPLTEVVLNYTAPTTLSEKGITVLRSDGTEMEPIQIKPTDNSYVLEFNPGLTEGVYAVAWEVLAADGHPLDGTFQFTVVNPPPTTPLPTTPATTNPDATTPLTNGTATTAPGASQTTPPSSTVSPTTIDPASTTIPPVPTTSPAFGELLRDDSSSGAVAISRIGHLLRFGGAIFGIGALAALNWVIQSDKRELYTVLNAVRISGIFIALGGALEWAAYQEVAGGGIGGLFNSRTGGAAILTMLGGVLMLFGLTERNCLEPVGSSFRWQPGPRSFAGLIGAGLVLVGFGFDGHLATRGPDLVVALADIVHVGVAALWAGGVVALAFVAWLRRRRGQPSLLAHSVVRFSPLAAIGLVAVTISGFILTGMISEDPTSPTSSPWGRALIVKLVFVALGIVAGAFNKFSLVPAINAHPDSEDTARTIRVSLTVEAAIFVVVVLITAVLVTLDLNPIAG